MLKLMSTGMALLCLMSFSCASEQALPTQIETAKIRVEAASEPPLIARNVFVKTVPLQEVLLSPNGKHVAYRLDKEHWQELWLFNLAEQTHKRLLNLKSLQALQWSADGQYLVYTHQHGVYRVGIQPSQWAQKLFDLGDTNSDFLGADDDIPGIYWTQRYDAQSKQFQLLRFTKTGQHEAGFSSRVPITGYLSHRGRLKIVKQLIDEQQQISSLEKGNLRPIIRCDALRPCSLLAWNEQNQRLLIASYFDQNTKSLYEVMASTGEKKRLHQEPTQRFDMLNVSIDDEGTVQFSSYHTDHVQHFALTDIMAITLQQIKSTVASPQIYIQASKNHRIFLINNADPMRSTNQFSIFNLDQQRWLSPFEHLEQETIDAKWIAPRIPFWYTASDGMQLQGYVTLPMGKKMANVPLLAMPHGGPWNRAQGTFSRQAQFLANRGYAVFEPNFRSSTGLGKHYVISAQKDFGDGRVQQDILDGLDYLMDIGIGDPKQQAIVGHSFGGFSVLSGLAFTPERFKVGFAGAAPSNLPHSVVRFGKNMPAMDVEQFDLRIKHLLVDFNTPEELDRLYQQSPDKHWRNITAPLYLWAGERDDRVAIEDVRDFALRLADKHHPVVLLSDPNGGHSPDSTLAREAYFYMLESALEKHLTGRIDRTVSSILTRYLNKYLTIDPKGLFAEYKRHEGT